MRRLLSGGLLRHSGGRRRSRTGDPVRLQDLSDSQLGGNAKACLEDCINGQHPARHRSSLGLSGCQGGCGSAEREKMGPAHAYLPWHAFWSLVSRKGANGHPT